jgi:hypothetical protein
MDNTKYEFTNFSDDSFTGRYNGVDYTFAPGETRSFDPDKHYMLILLAKQLADKELEKKVKSVGRDPKDMETWGKALDHMGKPLVITKDMRKTVMRQAIGVLVDTPIPIPEDQEVQEAGSTKEVSQDVKILQDQVGELKDMVSSLVRSQANQTQQGSVSPVGDLTTSPVGNQRQTLTEPVSMTREALTSLAEDAGITGTDRMTKEELIHAISGRQAQI